jgi:hypothetical protein
MVKAVGLLGIVALLLSAEAASAVYTPNPAGRWQKHRFFIAADVQYLKKDIDLPGPDNKTVEEEIYGMFVRPSFSIAPNVTVYGRIGFQDTDLVELGFAGGAGAQLAYPLPWAREWAIGVSYDFLYVEDSDFEDVPGSREWMEHQIAPGVSFTVPRVRALTTYAAALIDFVEAERTQGNGQSGGELEQDDLVGLAVGLTVDPIPNLRVDVQFRAISETAASLSVGYLF